MQPLPVVEDGIAPVEPAVQVAGDASGGGVVDGVAQAADGAQGEPGVPVISSARSFGAAGDDGDEVAFDASYGGVEVEDEAGCVCVPVRRGGHYLSACQWSWRSAFPVGKHDIQDAVHFPCLIDQFVNCGLGVPWFV